MNQKSRAVIQQINSKKKEIYVYCNTNGIIHKQNLRDTWAKRLPGYHVKFISVKTSKEI